MTDWTWSIRVEYTGKRPKKAIHDWLKSQGLEHDAKTHSYQRDSTEANYPDRNAFLDKLDALLGPDEPRQRFEVNLLYSDIVGGALPMQTRKPKSTRRSIDAPPHEDE